MKITLHPVVLELKEPFTISRGTYYQRKSLIVELSAAGKSGFGEAVEHAYYAVDRDEMIARAEAIRPLIEDYAFDNPGNFWAYLNPSLQGFSFLQCAIDNAAHDLYGKLSRLPSHKVWGIPAGHLPKTSYTLSIDDPEKMVGKVKALQFDIYKIKMAGTPQDIEIVEQLRRHTDARFTVDANCAWTAEQTIDYAPRLKELGVLFIEQPLHADDWHRMRDIYSKSALPLIADEACRREEDVEKCAGHFHGINIKLMKCGGLTPALRMIARAREMGLQVMCGCMIETTVGVSAIAQLLPQLDYVDMDGPLLISNDPAKGVHILPDGTVQLPEGDGLGISFQPPK
jgi:L-alanine-DL-glutamate epimerase-like enolase superfamily enzyme